MSKKSKQDGLYRRADSGSIWASYTDASGRRVRRSTGTADAREAEAILAKWKVEERNVRHWGEEPTRTFDELMVRYLDETQDLKRSADRDAWITINLKEYFTGKVLNTLGGEDVQGYIKWRREAHKREAAEARRQEELAKASGSQETQRKRRKRKKPISFVTIRRELSLLSAAINRAREMWEWKIPNAVEKRKPPQGEDRVRWIRPAEAEKLIVTAQREPRAPHLADFIVFGLHTGARLQEILGLEWPRVDMEQRLIYLPPGKNKSKRNVSVPLNEAAYEVLLRRKQFREEHCPKSTTPWVFCNKKGARIGSVKTAFTTACRRAGIEDFHPHDLRHTCAAWLVQAGVPLMQIRDLLRHTAYQVTEKYAHLAPEDVRNAVDVLNQKFGEGPREAVRALVNAAPSVDTSRSGHVRPKLTVIAGGKQ